MVVMLNVKFSPHADVRVIFDDFEAELRLADSTMFYLSHNIMKIGIFNIVSLNLAV